MKKLALQRCVSLRKKNFKEFSRTKRIIGQLSLSLILILGCTSFTSSENSEDEQWICEDAKYTYQIVLSERAKVNLPITICDEIESKRKQSSRVKIHYSDYVTIVVFSFDEIATLDTNIKEIVYATN